MVVAAGFAYAVFLLGWDQVRERIRGTPKGSDYCSKLLLEKEMVVAASCFLLQPHCCNCLLSWPQCLEEQRSCHCPFF